MKKILLVTTLLLSLVSAAFGTDFRRAKPTLDDVFGASCRVSVEGARGSGLFVYYQGQKAYVLTNYHVVQNNMTATLDFWTNHVRQSVRGKVVKRFSDRRANLDFAIIEVDADELKKIDPPFIPLAPVDPTTLTGRKIYAAGGPKGWFVQSWRGANESVESGLVLFSPHPVPGQSGSGVCTIIDGQIYAVEVLTYLLGDENSDSSKGGALPVLYLANALKGVRYDFGDALDKAKPIPVADTTSDLSILAFTTTDCPACDIGEAGLKAYEETGGVVKRVDPNDQKYSNVALAYGVTETPTYFVVDANNEPLLRISYDDIKREGAIAAVRVGVASAKPKPKPESKPEPKAVEQKPEAKTVVPPAPDPVVEEVQLDSDHAVVISEAGEPKRTLPVYVTDPKEYALDLRQPVYDDTSSTVSLDLFSNWRNHDEADGEEETPNDSTGDRNENQSQSQKQLGDRIADRLANALAPKIDKSVNTAAELIAKNIQQSIVDQLEDENAPLGAMKKDLEEKARATAKRYLWRIAIDVVILMIIAQLATQGVIAICKRLFLAGVEMRKEVARYRDYLENGNGK